MTPSCLKLSAVAGAFRPVCQLRKVESSTCSPALSSTRRRCAAVCPRSRIVASRVWLNREATSSFAGDVPPLTLPTGSGTTAGCEAGSEGRVAAEFRRFEPAAFRGPGFARSAANARKIGRNAVLADARSS